MTTENKIETPDTGKVFLKIIDYFIPAKYLLTENFDTGLKVRVSVGFALSAMFFSIPAFAIVLFSNGSGDPLSKTLPFLILLVCVNLFGGTVLYLIRKGTRLFLPFLILSLSFSTINAALSFYNGGVMDAALIWVLYIGLLSTFIEGPRFGFFITVYNSGIMVALFVFKKLGFVFPNLLTESAQDFMTISMLVMLSFALVFIAWLYEISRNYAWKKEKEINRNLIQETENRKHAEASLQQANRELNALNRNLEMQVKVEMEKLRKSEQILIQQSKMIAMGEMIGAIAHQWRQPLNSLALSVQDLVDASKAGELDEEYLVGSVNNAMKHINHMSSTIDDFRNFLKPSKDKVKFDLIDAIKNALDISRPQITNHDIDIKLYIDNQNDQKAATEGYPNELKQVFLNLINNSKDAIEHNRTIENNQAPSGYIHIKIECMKEAIDNRRHYQIIFEDNGGGISQEALDRLFEPYYTTKPIGQGTGLGLYMARQIIESSMNGKISAENGNEGARFIIYIPVLLEDKIIR